MGLGTTLGASAQQAPPRRRPWRIALLVAAFAALALAISWFFAAAPLTGVEPNAEFVDCGPALVGRPSPLPDPACGPAYGAVVFLSVAFGIVGVAGLLSAVLIAIRVSGGSTDRVSPTRPLREGVTPDARPRMRRPTPGHLDRPAHHPRRHR